MKYSQLGKGGLQVSRIAFGTWQLGGDWGPTDAPGATQAIERAAEMGVTLFDTAQGYGFGESERLLAQALSTEHRENLVIATKGGLRPTATGGVKRDSSPEWLRTGVEASLVALGAEYIDLFQIHWPDPTTPLAQTAEALAVLIAEGKIRHVGVSNFDVAQMETFSATLPVETLQPPYDLFRRDIEVDVLPYTTAKNIGVLVYGPLAHGLLSGHMGPDTRFLPDDWRSHNPTFQGDSFKRNLDVVTKLSALATEELGITLAQLAVAWVLANSDVQVAIVGTRNPVHVVEALAAADIDLDASVLQRINQILAGAVAVIGPSPEGM